MKFTDLLQKLDNTSKGIGLPDGWVPATMLYGFIGTTIIGRIHIRHHLTKILKIDGGHIGYAVSKQHRNKGYASKMLKLAVPMCRKLGINEILLTPADENSGSAKVIENAGGQHSTTVISSDGKKVRHYWIK